MKKILTLLSLLLLPLLAFSYELDSEYTNFAKELKNDLKTDIKYQQTNYDFPDDYYVDKIQAIIDSSIGLFEDKIIFQRYYKTGQLKTYLDKQNLTDVLKNNKQVLHQAARYIVRNYPHNNDYEALLAIGVDPVEAAIRLNNEENIKSALEKGTITYPHCYTVTSINMDNSSAVLNGYIEPSTIEVNTTQEQIEDIKLKIQLQETIRKKSRLLRKFWDKINYFHW